MPKQYSAVLMWNSVYVIKELTFPLIGNLNETQDVNCYPTVTFSMSVSASDYKENPDWDGTSNGGEDKPDTAFRYMFKLTVEVTFNYKLPYSLNIPYQVLNMTMDDNATGYETEKYLSVAAGDDVKTRMDYVYTNAIDETTLIDLDLMIKHVAGGGTMNVPQYLQDGDDVRVVTDTASWLLHFNDLTCNEDPAYVITQETYYFTTGIGDCDEITWQATNIYYRPSTDKYYSDEQATELIDGCYTLDNGTSTNDSFRFYQFTSGVRGDVVVRSCSEISAGC
jgi:hypothetical protein